MLLKKFSNLFKSFLRKNIIIRNVFNTKYSKNILISYIVHPFLIKNNCSHTNFQEAKEIANIFKEKGFNVDVVDYSFKRKLNFEGYDLIFGFGNQLEESFYQNVKFGLKRVYYATGSQAEFQNIQALKRVVEFERKSNQLLLESIRLTESDWYVQDKLSDFVIVLGNESTLATYRVLCKKLNVSPKIMKQVVSYNTNLKRVEIEDLIENKNYTEARKTFIWFGSKGAIHKGLDILIDYFSVNPGLNLIICGPIRHEEKFLNYFNEKISQSSNIQIEGFVNVESTVFKKIIEKSCFVILPSCSEGQSTSVINMMSVGMVPVVTKNTGLNFECPFEIESLNVDSISKVMMEISTLSNQDVRKLSINSFRYVLRNHSLSNFGKVFKENIEEVLDD